MYQCTKQEIGDTSESSEYKELCITVSQQLNKIYTLYNGQSSAFIILWPTVL